MHTRVKTKYRSHSAKFKLCQQSHVLKTIVAHPWCHTEKVLPQFDNPAHTFLQHLFKIQRSFVHLIRSTWFIFLALLSSSLTAIPFLNSIISELKENPQSHSASTNTCRWKALSWKVARYSIRRENAILLGRESTRQDKTLDTERKK